MFARRHPDRSATCPVGEDLPTGRGGVVVIVPGVEAPIFHLVLPTGLTGAARLRVARQQLSDRLSTSPDQLDLTPVPAGAKGGWNSVICTSTDLRQGWCATGPVRDGRVRAVLPEYFSLPGAEDTLSATEHAGMVHARLGLQDGFSAPAALAADLLRAALGQHNLRRAVLSGALPQSFLDAIADAGLSSQTGSLSTGRYEAFELALDLRNADTTQGNETAKGLRLWAAAVAASLLAFVIWAISLHLETRAIERDATALRQATVDVLRKGLLPQGPILDVRQQVTQRLGTAGSGSNGSENWVLDRLSMLSVVLFGKGARVQSLAFDPTRGHSAVVLTRDFATAESLLADLQQSGFETVDTSVRAQDSGDVELRFRVPAAVSGEIR